MSKYPILIGCSHLSNCVSCSQNEADLGRRRAAVFSGRCSMAVGEICADSKSVNVKLYQTSYSLKTITTFLNKALLCRIYK